jgi:hypothetical protein
VAIPVGHVADRLVGEQVQWRVIPVCGRSERAVRLALELGLVALPAALLTAQFLRLPVAFGDNGDQVAPARSATWGGS